MEIVSGPTVALNVVLHLKTLPSDREGDHRAREQIPGKEQVLEVSNSSSEMAS